LVLPSDIEELHLFLAEFLLQACLVLTQAIIYVFDPLQHAQDFFLLGLCPRQARVGILQILRELLYQLKCTDVVLAR
jgi:hypothetical protein